MRFEGQTAIVTGAARGIGEAIAPRLAARRGSCCIADIDEAAAQTAAASIGERAIAHRLDVTDPASWDDRRRPPQALEARFPFSSTTPASQGGRRRSGI